MEFGSEQPASFCGPVRGRHTAHDPYWQIHKEFFATVGDHLADDGVIVLQENNRGSVVETFRSMIEQSGLQIVFTHGDHPTLTKDSSFYFIGITRQGAAQTAWASGTVICDIRDCRAENLRNPPALVSAIERRPQLVMENN